MKSNRDSASLMHDYMVTLERFPSARLEQYDRQEKYEVLQDHGSTLRSILLDWIQQHGISEEVEEVGQATAFNLLFVRGTEHALKLLREAPGVVDVVPAENLPIELY